jgi:hypothetical protein
VLLGKGLGVFWGLVLVGLAGGCGGWSQGGAMVFMG